MTFVVIPMGADEPNKKAEGIVSPVADIFSLLGKTKPTEANAEPDALHETFSERSPKKRPQTMAPQTNKVARGEVGVPQVLDLSSMLKQKSSSKPQRDDVDSSDSTSIVQGLEKEIQRLKRRLEREKGARYQSETTSEDISRALFIAQNEAKEANGLLEAANSEMAEVNEKLANSMAKLTNAQIKRKALTITLVVAVSLFILSEFFLEAMLETRISNTGLLVLAKLSIFGTLFPLEAFVSKLLTGRITQDEDVNKSMYIDLLHSAYDDGIITDMERKLLDSSRKQLGITAKVAKTLENEVVRKKMRDHNS